MNKNIKVIQTKYRGYNFRSRAEAKWAVFFDSIGMAYDYEPEGLDINGKWYLPDFYLKESNSFFEVKGVMDEESAEKVKALIDAGYSVTVGYSDFTFNACDNFGVPFTMGTKEESVLVECNKCGGKWFMGLCGSYECQCCGYHDGDHHFELIAYGDGRGRYGKRYNPVFNVAKQARFEHGDTPITDHKRSSKKR